MMVSLVMLVSFRLYDMVWWGGVRFECGREFWMAMARLMLGHVGAVDLGGRIQRLGVKVMEKAPQAITNKKHPFVDILRSPMMPPSPNSLRDILPKCSSSEALLIRPPKVSTRTVFYFPGCGSERLYSEISKASLYILLKSDIQVIIPHPYLCCGFPARVNAKKKMYGDITLRDTIILSQIREMLGHIEFDSVLISCGTCREALHKIGCEDIFDCAISDVSQYAMQKSPDLFKTISGKFLYHAPCHDSLEGNASSLLQNQSTEITEIPDCCSEAGTMAISRPDISSAMRKKKRASLYHGMVTTENEQIILTNCPSCISGLGRNKDMNIKPRHIAEMLAVSIGGENWESELENLINASERVTF